MKLTDSETTFTLCPDDLPTTQNSFDQPSQATSAGTLKALRSCDVIVAIPVQNEEHFIANCLLALARQSVAYRHRVILLLNNCTDDTSTIIRNLVPRLPMPVLTINTTLPPRMANAGAARRLAMQYAAQLASPGSVLMTTDADGQVSTNWIAANLAALRAGADAVAGRAELDHEDASQLPARLREDDARECEYDQTLDEIRSILDPDPADPWPRHTEDSGASIAVTLDAYFRVGGFPNVPMGEDRAFIAALRRMDARIRHSPDVRVVVSGRIDGRAVGGMADTIRRRLTKSDEVMDERFEPARIATKRAWIRGLLRTIWGAGRSMPNRVALLSRLSSVVGFEIEALLRSSYFGEAWAQLETSSTALRKSQLRVSDLPNEMQIAGKILESLKPRAGAITRVQTDPADSPDFAATEQP
jgi:glycosyltransferase involved in cell wall biosynthesis